MAKQPRNTIKNWFKRGLKPIESQFHDWLDSFVHKDDSIAISNVTNLQTQLNGKASATDVADLQALFIPQTPIIFSPTMESTIIPSGKLLTHIVFRALDGDEVVDVERVGRELMYGGIALIQGSFTIISVFLFTKDGQETLMIKPQGKVEVWFYMR